MKNIATGFVAVAALGLGVCNGALAADMPVRYVAPAPVATWTGFYASVDLGYARQTNSDAWNPLPSPAGFGVVAGGINGQTGSPQDRGVVGGFNFGYNYQFWSAWVAGIEGDFMWASLGTNNAGPWVTPGGLINNAASLTNFAESVNWLASVRGRLGWLWTPNLMLYGTGGFAWENVHYSANAFNGVAGGAGSYNANVDFTNTNSGWVAGVGIEWLISSSDPRVFWNNWTLRTEWLHYQFQASQNVTANSVNFPAFPSNYTWSSDKIDVLRAALSYKF
jgi:outer membrane immunogenic protein